MSSFFFFNDTATTEIYTLSLHDALPISRLPSACVATALHGAVGNGFEEMNPVTFNQTLGCLSQPVMTWRLSTRGNRSEEHTSELQSQSNLVCRLLLEKKKKIQIHLSVTSLNFTYVYKYILFFTI